METMLIRRIFNQSLPDVKSAFWMVYKRSQIYHISVLFENIINYEKTDLVSDEIKSTLSHW